MERTFVLCFPVGLYYKKISEILMKFELNSLNIIRIRLVCGTDKFFTQYFSLEGRTLPPEVSAAGYCAYPFVAIEVEGDDAISKVHQLTSEHYAGTNGLCHYASHTYSSDSVKSAEEDCGFWFGIDSGDWVKEARESNHLAIALPDGETFGPVDTVTLIFCNRLMLGMDMVTKSSPTGDAWPADSRSSDDIDGYGIALPVEYFHLEKEIHITTNCRGDGNIWIDQGKTEICSGLIHIGKPGDTSMIGNYFKCGNVSWVDSSTGALCGGYFMATLSSLKF
ncbi:hypothetical protein MKW94_024303 [Papaver nudicaule]|uniref:Nucleoside diphosphate kinase-like domain-containing protein n=1 Tax=Papaver nudicaule TaxID=74823 RepID=A0AA41W1M0_PAPNU|nr:hypothetical protein [Papaver nudicaule]